MRFIVILLFIFVIVYSPSLSQENRYLYPDYQTYQFESIEIEGPLDFINMIYQGLIILKTRSYPHYKYVCNHTKKIIFQGTGKKMDVIAFTWHNGNDYGIYEIYFIARTVTVTNPDDYGPLIGSILVHESSHLAGWNEPDAYYFQIETLKALKASQKIINYWEHKFAPLIKFRQTHR
ncbi:MAG: hypothetical protein BWY64_00479 [bacterium ADurb.Bin363]|nr:MAG: hypothetical protein BWY64_00479 [bacterium ADurb.Bin363]